MATIQTIDSKRSESGYRPSIASRAAAALLVSIATFSAADARAQVDDTQSVTQHLARERFTLIAPFPPGGPVDLLARMLADGLHRRYGQPAVVENLPGGAGNPGMDRVRRAKPSGHTLLVIPAGNLTINPTLMSNFPFRIERDFSAISMLAKARKVLIAHPSRDTTDFASLIAAIRADPRRFSYASPRVGSGLHLAGELFRQRLGLDIQHVPYKGTTPALNDVVAGVVPLMFSNLPAVLPHLRSGRIVAIAVTDNARSPLAKDIPTLAELGVEGVVVSSWYGLMAPAGTPDNVISRLAEDASAILGAEAVTRQLAAQAMTASPMSPEAFAAHIRNETLTWRQVIVSQSIRAE
ncbi:MAG: Bug family tripartite tricarboxylate transporter substrate binding protein [Betaproteobacteria bacterium]